MEMTSTSSTPSTQRRTRYAWMDVTEASQISAARREASDLATRLGMDATGVGQAALVATELGTNLVKHARQGELALRAIPEEQSLELLAIDRGPGIRNMADAMRDGYSTAGTPGGGLGAIRRLSTSLDLFSGPKGTVARVLLRKGTNEAAPRTRLQIGGVCRAKQGETACGDDWSARSDADGATVLVADGLGHGPLAAVPAATAVEVLARGDRDPLALMQTAHGRLRGTRGAAVGILRIERGQATYAGVGNIVCRVLGAGASRQLVSHSGIVGHEARKMQSFSAPVSAGQIVVLHSDGLGSQWTLDPYPGLASRHAAVIAAVLYRDFRRGNDDATVVVVKVT